MKPASLFACAILLCSAIPGRSELLLKPNDVLALAGDSITQQKIYTVYIEDYLLMCQQVDGLRIVQEGQGSERAGGFFLRIGTDLLPFKPTVVVTCYGMNDGNYRLMDDMTARYYQKPLQQIIDQLKADGMREIIIASPGAVDTRSFKRLAPDAYNHTLDTLRGIAKDVAEKNGLNFIDVHTPMMDVMAKAQAAYGDAYIFIGGDGIHPGPAGHLVMAWAILKGLGCDGDIGTINVDLGAGQATGTSGQKVLSCENGTVTLESTRYPFCFQGDPDKSANTTASVLKFFPFDQDLNRYMLVVKGIKGSKAKVTWGENSKEFSADELAKGVNLAAEFLVNPFCTRFFKVDAAVQAQQALETTLEQQFLRNLPALKTMVPGESDSIDKIAAGGLKKDTDLFDAAKALVIPIRHTIQITPEP